MAKKRVDPIKQREKRAKIAMAGLCAVLLLVAVYEVPSMMKVLNKKPPAGAYISDAGNRNADGSIAGLPSVAIPTGVSVAGDLTDTDLPPVASSEGQLVSFSLFEPKNPFTPQVTTKTSIAPDLPAGAAVPTTTTTTTTTPAGTVPPGGSPSTSVVPSSPAGGTTTSTSTTTTVTPQPTVAISVNGVVSKVSSGGTFPSGSPVFRLSSWKSGTAQIGIVGGSYSAGNQTLTLQQGVTVTLQNQTDGKQYHLQLLSTP